MKILLTIATLLLFSGCDMDETRAKNLQHFSKGGKLVCKRVDYSARSRWTVYKDDTVVSPSDYMVVNDNTALVIKDLSTEVFDLYNCYPIVDKQIFRLDGNTHILLNGEVKQLKGQ